MLDLKKELQVDKRLEKIWSDHYEDESDILSPLYPKELRKNSVTFLSLNPSLRPESRKDAKRGYYPDLPYPLIDCKKEKADYSFFQKFYDIGRNCKPWTVLDLLYERESTQAQLENRYKRETITEKDKKFLQDQISLTFRILEMLEPKVVVVSNAGSDRFIHEHLEKLGLKQTLPQESNGFIYRINDIPFIALESRFLGSRYHQYNKEKRAKLEDEISRILREI